MCLIKNGDELNKKTEVISPFLSISLICTHKLSGYE